MTIMFPISDPPGDDRSIILISDWPTVWHVVDSETNEVLEKWRRDGIFSKSVCTWRKQDMNINEGTFKYYNFGHHYSGDDIGITDGHYKIESICGKWLAKIKIVGMEYSREFDSEKSAMEWVKEYIARKEAVIEEIEEQPKAFIRGGKINGVFELTQPIEIVNGKIELKHYSVKPIELFSFGGDYLGKITSISFDTMEVNFLVE